MNSKAKGVVFWAVLIGVAGLLWAVIQNKPNSAKATYSQFLQQVQSGQVSKAIIIADHSGANPVTYNLKDGTEAHTVVPSNYQGVLEALQQKMVNIEIRDASRQWVRMLANASPFLVLLGFWVFMMRRMPNRPGAK
jgi:cell division protease FtsH